MKTLVSVVVPVYNEESNVPILAERIEAVFASLDDYEYECVFVNDGSTDGTGAQLARLSVANSKVRALHFEKNTGQSAALVAGLRHAKGEYIFTLDGDLQNDPCDIPKFLELLKDYDLVCGYRVKRQDNLVRRVSSTLANSARRAVLRDGVRDSGCGTKGMRRCCLQHIISFNGVHRFLPVILQKAGMSLVECEVTHHPREHGRSKYGIHNRLWRGIHDLFGVRWLRKRYVTYKIEGEE